MPNDVSQRYSRRDNKKKEVFGKINITSRQFRNEAFGAALTNFFDSIYCINLDSRRDRWCYVKDHLSLFGLKDLVKRFSAVDVRSHQEFRHYERLQRNNFSLLGACGCLLSHRAIIEAAFRAGSRSVLIFEDDVEILEDHISYIEKSLKELEQYEWDVFYLGGTYHFPLRALSPHLVNVHRGAYATHAIAYHERVFERILDVIPSSPKEFVESNQFDVNALDKWFQSDLFNHDRFFGTNPIMVVQGLQESDIASKLQDGIKEKQIALFFQNLEKCR